jgi:hypothetical protein
VGKGGNWSGEVGWMGREEGGQGEERSAPCGRSRPSAGRHRLPPRPLGSWPKFILINTSPASLPPASFGRPWISCPFPRPSPPPRTLPYLPPDPSLIHSTRTLHPAPAPSPPSSSGNQIGDPGLMALAPALARLSAVKALELRSVRFLPTPHPAHAGVSMWGGLEGGGWAGRRGGRGPEV